MEVDSALILYSGIELHVSADEYLPFEANRNFFYLTGLRRDHMILLMKKTEKEEKSILFIEEADPTQERWFGRKVTVSEAQEISGIEDVRFLDSFEGMAGSMMDQRGHLHAVFRLLPLPIRGSSGLQRSKSEGVCRQISGPQDQRHRSGSGCSSYVEGCGRDRAGEKGHRHHR